MILLATFSSELEAELLASKLKAAGIDYKLQDGQSDGFKLQVFEDDLDEAREIYDAAAFEGDIGGSKFDDDDDNINFDELEG
ncbi:MAG: DUF2007 domain-containing protein [Candidatus Kapabacteria bacterium]|nr:DUF2007 domain-containing protein [Candidatus Kapabacteria bacterium]